MNKLTGDILIVDDLPENLKVLAQMLTGKGYRVRKAINGEMALTACNSSPPDLILLDIKMPEMDGYQVCEKLKCNPKTREIPVIFLSALNEVFDKVKAFQVGGLDYISKPFQIEEVMVRIESQLTIQRQKKELKNEIQKRKETEQILYQSRALLASVLNSSLDGIAALEAVRKPLTAKIEDFRCTIVNPILAQFLGTESEDLVGKLFCKKIIKNFDPTLFERLINLVERGNSLEEDIYYQSKKQAYWYHLIAVKLGDGFAVSIRDITKRKKLELTLQKTNEDLEAFSYSVSHDLRNYLTQINFASQLIKDEENNNFNDKTQELINIIDQASWRMEKVIDDLMVLAKIKQRQLRITDVNLSVIIEFITKRLQQQSPNRKAEFIITPNTLVKGDESLLTIVLDNLLHNAWKYSSKKEFTTIEFGLLSNKNNPKIYFIKDNGVGFNMEKAEQIFTPFQRLHSTTDFEGNGIGLSIVQRIVELHGGKIWCDSKVNQGAIFYFTLL